MKKAVSISFFPFILLSLISFWSFCTDPSKPDFGDAPLIGNNKNILTAGTEKIGEPFLMYVSVAGTDPFVFEWFQDDSLIINSDRDSTANDSLKFDTLSESDRGRYYCIVSNDFGADTTEELVLKINYKPVFADSMPDTLYQILEGALLSIPVLATDLDNDSIHYGIDTTTLPRPDSVSFLNDTTDTGNTISWQSLIGDNGGIYSMTIFASDSIDTTYAYIKIVVQDVKFPPVLDSISDTTIYEGQQLSFTVSATDVDGDSISIDTSSFPPGAAFIDNGNGTGAFTWQPAYTDSGTYTVTFYARDSVLADSQTVTIRVNDFKFIISATADTGGTLSPSGDVLIEPGANQKFTIVPDTGFHIVDVLVDSVSTGIVAEYTFTQVSSNHTLQAIFAINTYTLTVSSDSNGTTLPAGDTTVNHGSATTITATGSTGYHLTKWQCISGTAAIADTTADSTTVVLENGAAEIKAFFAMNKYTVSVTAQGNGTATVTPVKPFYSHGDTVQLTAAPSVGNTFTGWSGDVSSTANPMTVIVTSNLNITANFAINQHTVTFVAGANGSITGTLVQTVAHGGNCSTVTAVPDANYHFGGWTGDYTGTDNPLTITNVTADMTITANFAQYTVTFAAGSNGSIIGTLVQTIAHGSDCSPVTAAPDANYHFTGWTGDYTGTDNPLTITNVTSDMTITAVFAIDSHTVTFVAGSNGSITGTLVQTIGHGSDCTPVTANASNGYQFTQWAGDYTGTTNPLTVQNVTSAMSITANFLLQADFYVDANTGNNVLNDGSWQQPFLTISHAVDTAPAGDWQNPVIIHVLPGTYNTALGETFPIKAKGYQMLIGDVANKGCGQDSTIIAGWGECNNSYADSSAVESGRRIAGFVVKGPTGTSNCAISMDQQPVMVDNNTLIGGGRGVYIFSQGPSDGDTIQHNNFINTKTGIHCIYRAPRIISNSFLNPLEGSYAIVSNNEGEFLRNNIFNCINGVLLEGDEYNQNIDLGTSGDPGNNDFSLVTGIIINILKTPNPATPINALGNIWPSAEPDCTTEIIFGAGVTGTVFYGPGISDNCTQ